MLRRLAALFAACAAVTAAAAAAAAAAPAPVPPSPPPPTTFVVTKLATADPLTEIGSSSVSFTAETLIDAGTVSGAWKTCLDGLQGVAKPDNAKLLSLGCRIEADYLDRISFAATVDDTKFPALEPSVTATGGSALPAVEEYKFNNVTKIVTFTVLYQCAANKEGLSVMNLALGSAKVRWGKQCRTGVNKLLELGYKSVSGDVISLSHATAAKEILIPPMSELTELHVDVLWPAVAQVFGPVTLTSRSPEVLSVKARGVSKSGTLFAGLFSAISVMYECHSFSKAFVDVRIAVPPWHDLTATFLKDCGGSFPHFLSVGTTKTGDDIVKEGVAKGSLSKQKAGTSLGALGDQSIILDVPEDKHVLDLYVRHVGTANDGSLHFSDAVVTVHNQRILRVITKGHLGKALWSHGGVLEGGETFDLSLHFACLRKGRSTVTVSFPLLRYRTMEFSFTKNCGVPSVHQSNSLFNVKAIEDLALAAVVLAALALLVCLRLRRNSRVSALNGLMGDEPKYERVST